MAEAVAGLEKTVVCFGDSITHGFGVPEENSYPSLLARLLDCRVINAGVDGDTTFGALERLAQDVLRHEPGLVTIEFGANDYLDGTTRAQVQENLEQITRGIQKSGAESVLLSLGEEFWDSEFEAAVRQAAQKTGSRFLTGLLGGIVDNRLMTLDGVHPNATGYIVIARRVADFLLSREDGT